MKAFVSEAQAYQKIRRQWKQLRNHAQRSQSSLMHYDRVDLALPFCEDVGHYQQLLNRFKIEKEKEKETV